MIWNKEMECMDRKSMEALQLERLKENGGQSLLSHSILPEIPGRKGRKAGRYPNPGGCGEAALYQKAGFAGQLSLRLFAVPLKEVVRLHASSGTTGKPIVEGYTKNDLEVWSEGLARIAAMATRTAEDVVQIAFGYGLFTGGFGLHYAIEKVGATVVPMSSGNSEKQIMLMQDFGTTVLISTPSYALHLAEVAKKTGTGSQKGSEGSGGDVRRRALQSRYGGSDSRSLGDSGDG